MENKNKLNITIANNKMLIKRIDMSKTKAGIYINRDNSGFHVEGEILIIGGKTELFPNLKVGDIIIYDKGVEPLEINTKTYDLIYETNIKYIKH